MVVQIPLRLITHEQKIASAYKRYLRLLEANYFCRERYRYEAVLIRAEFDCILNAKDMRVSKQMLLQKEEEMSSLFVLPPVYWPDSPEGISYKRKIEWPDFLLDAWHPLEKSVFPKYFAKREVRKQQYMEMWEKKYGPPPPEDH